MNTKTKSEVVFIAGFAFTFGACMLLIWHYAKIIGREHYINAIMRVSLDRGDFDLWESE